MHLLVAGHSGDGRLIGCKYDGYDRSTIRQFTLYTCNIGLVGKDENVPECGVLHRLTSIHRILARLLRKSRRDQTPYAAQTQDFRRYPV